jgi:hypothetical protein
MPELCTARTRWRSCFPIAVYSQYTVLRYSLLTGAGAFYWLYAVPELPTTSAGCRSFLLVVRGTETAYNQCRVPELFTGCTRYRNCVQPVHSAGAIYIRHLEHDGRVYNALSALMLKLQYSNNRRHCLCIPPCLFQRICGLYDSTGRNNTLCTNMNLNM